jgi:hypothetical protein
VVRSECVYVVVVDVLSMTYSQTVGLSSAPWSNRMGVTAVTVRRHNGVMRPNGLSPTSVMDHKELAALKSQVNEDNPGIGSSYVQGVMCGGQASTKTWRRQPAMPTTEIKLKLGMAGTQLHI